MKIPIFQMHRSEEPHPGGRPGQPGEPFQISAAAASAAAVSASAELHRLRERILGRIYLAAAALGLAALLANLPVLTRQGSWQGAWVFALAYLLLLIAGFLPAVRYRLSYQVRAALLLLVLFGAGLLTLVQNGLYGSGRVFLLALPIFSAILLDGSQSYGNLGFGRAGRMVGLGLSIGGLAVVAALMLTGYLPAPVLAPGTGNDSLASWTAALFSFSLLAAGSVLALGALLDGLRTSLEKQSRLSAGLATERQRLEENVRQRTADLERRLAQLRTAAEIAGSIHSPDFAARHSDERSSTGVNLPELLSRVCELVRERFNLYYVGVFLVETADAQTAYRADAQTAYRGEDSNAASATGSSRLAGGGSRQAAASPVNRGDASSSPGRQYAVLAAGTGAAGRAMLVEGHRLLVGGDSMIGTAIATQQPRIALDVANAALMGQEAVRFNNPHLPRTRSELALPILSRATSPVPPFSEQARAEAGTQAGIATTADAKTAYLADAKTAYLADAKTAYRALGAMTIQSSAEAAFDQDDILVLQGIADSLAGAIENSRLLAETRRGLEEIQRLHRQYLEQAWAVSLADTPAEALEARWETGAALEAEPAVKLDIPIQLRGQTIGSLALEGNTSWSGEQRLLVEAVANQAALALENARLLAETRRKAEQERLSAQLASRMWAAQDIDSILQTALLELAQALNASEAEIELDV